MEQYTLKLSQGTSYKLYEGTTLMPDAELEALFASNGSAYFVFDFDGSTPSSTTTVQIVDSTDEVIVEKTGVSISEDRNYKGTWSGATTFDSFEVLSGKSLDEYQVKFLMSEIKKPVGADRIDSSAVTESKIANSAVTTNKLADGSVTGAANAAVDVTGSKVALSTVGTPNMRDSAITTAKLADNAITTAKITDANVTSAKLADSAVTTAKIANAAVTSGKIANGAVTADKIASTVHARFTDIRTNNIPISITESNPTELNSITITTPGVYLLLATAGVTQETSPHVFFYSKFTSSGGTFIPSASGSKPGFCVMTTTAQAERTTMKMESIISVTGNTTVRSVLWQSDTAAAHIEYQRTLIAIRIG